MRRHTVVLPQVMKRLGTQRDDAAGGRGRLPVTGLCSAVSDPWSWLGKQISDRAVSGVDGVQVAQTRERARHVGPPAGLGDLAVHHAGVG